MSRKLWPGLITIVQRSAKERGRGRKIEKRTDMKAGRDGICSSCLAHMHVVMREAMDMML